MKDGVDQQAYYSNYKDCGINVKLPPGHKKSHAHVVLDVKYDGRHNARIVAEGNLTNAPLSSIYSGDLSLRVIRFVIFLAELNGLDSWGNEFGNAYLETEKKEKVCIITGSEFGEL